MRVRFPCPVCEAYGKVSLPGAETWTCPSCDHVVQFPQQVNPALTSCAVCGSADLYRKKDFPHGLGMGILVGAIIASTFTYWWYDKWLTWTILLGSAAFDGLLYLVVKDVVECYRCHAEHRDVVQPERVAPFELTIHERYRQERLRKEELKRTGI